LESGFIKHPQASRVAAFQRSAAAADSAGKSPGIGLGLLERDIPAMTIERKIGKLREFDEAHTIARSDSFMELLGLEKIEA